MLIVGNETLFTKSEQVKILREFVEDNNIDPDSIADCYLDMIGKMLGENRYFVAGALGVKRDVSHF